MIRSFLHAPIDCLNTKLNSSNSGSFEPLDKMANTTANKRACEDVALEVEKGCLRSHRPIAHATAFSQ